MTMPQRGCHHPAEIASVDISKMPAGFTSEIATRTISVRVGASGALRPTQNYRGTVATIAPDVLLARFLVQDR